MFSWVLPEEATGWNSSNNQNDWRGNIIRIGVNVTLELKCDDGYKKKKKKSAMCYSYAVWQYRNSEVSSNSGTVGGTYEI